MCCLRYAPRSSVESTALRMIAVNAPQGGPVNGSSVGGVLLTAEAPSAEQLPFPVVTFTARDGGWTAECQGASLVVVRAPDGRLVSRPGEPVA